MQVIHATTFQRYEGIIARVGRRQAADGTWVDDDLHGRIASRNTETVLVTRDGRYRHGVGYSEPFTWVNQGQDMPRRFTTEPVAYAFGLSIALTANPAMSTKAESERNRAAGIEHDVTDGDWLVTDCQYVFEIETYRGGEYVRFKYLGLWSELYRATTDLPAFP